MAKIKNSIFINAPVEKVFEYFDDVTNMPEIWPSMVSVSDRELLPNGGQTHLWVYKMGGINMKGRSTDVEWVRNQRKVTKSTGGIESTMVWMFEPENGGTKFTTEVEYKIPIPVLGRFAEAIIARLNDRESKTVLANLKDVMEAWTK